MNSATSKTIIGAIKKLPPKERIIVVDWIKKHERELQTIIDEDDSILINSSVETLYKDEPKEEGEAWEKLFENHRRNGKIQSV